MAVLVGLVWFGWDMRIGLERRDARNSNESDYDEDRAPQCV